jgi:hypothetical protein
MLRNVLLSLSIGVCVAACSSSNIQTTVPVLQTDSEVAVPRAQPMNFNSVQWQVVGLAELKELVATLEKSQQKQVLLFALDATNYNNLTQNLVEIERYIKEQKAILAMLKKILDDRSAATQQATGAVAP